MPQIPVAPPALSPPPLLDTRHDALFLDLDGTLVDFADHPDYVWVEPALPPLLRGLRDALDGALALLSGRALSSLAKVIALDGLCVGALHGAQRRDASGHVQEAAPPASMALVRARLSAAQSRLPELWIEDKGSALALHYRRAPHLHAAVCALAEEAVDGIADAQLLPGDRVLEIRAPGQDKGKALAHFMAQAPFAGRRPFAIGDDHTDEDAFAAAQARGGCGVVVGARRPTLARCALDGPETVRRWLQRSLDRAQAVSA